MKSLYSTINESYGVVNGENSWRELSERIYNYFSSIPTIRHKYVIRKNLSPWLDSVIIERNPDINKYGDFGSFNDDKSSIINSKCQAVIEIGEKISQSVIEHELQHAFDFWIARTKRNMKNELSDKYCTGVGYEWDDVSAYPVSNDIDKVNCDVIFCMFKETSYFFEPTEINAYVREFDLYLGQQLKKGDVSFETMIGKDINPSGIGPLVWMMLLNAFIENAPKFKTDENHVDWEYVEKGIHDNFSKRYLGRNIKGNTPMESAVKTAKYIMNHQGRKCVLRFRKVMEHHMMETGNKVTDLPKWFKEI